VANACGITLATALALATGNPGSLLGGRGQLTVGQPADLMLFRWRPGNAALDICKTLIAGEPSDVEPRQL
jgi:N-acetylglucosamine-6-phosphate deacetylase